MSEAWTFPLCPQPPDYNLDWQGLVDLFDWIRAMDGCPQDPRFHAEGDVLIHTRMVCEQIVSSDAWKELDPEARSMLFSAALFHDVAKPACTKEEDGVITSRGHSRRGAQLAQRLLYQNLPPTGSETPFNVRQEFTRLVKWHGVPLWIWDRESPARKAMEVSLSISCEMLALLAEVDVMGRHCEDKKELLERVELFRELCDENRCLHHPMQFASDHTRFLYFRKTGILPDYPIYDDTESEVVMMSGLPGAGKDHWVRRNLPDWPVISLDEIRNELGIDPADSQGKVVAHGRDQAKGFLQQNQSFIWNATNVSSMMRRGLIDFFSAYRARIRIVYVEPDWHELTRRNTERARPVPEKILLKLLDKLEVPALTEAHQVDHIPG